MNCWRLLHLICLLRSGLCSPPPPPPPPPSPLNVIVVSHNYHHVLQWDSPPDTPAGTLFKIYRRGNDGTKLLNSTTARSAELTISAYEESRLFVVASYNGTDSPKATAASFTPFSDTKIGPPEVSLAPCGNCIAINISLPEPDIRLDEQVPQSDPLFKISWRKKEETEPKVSSTRGKHYTLDNLEKGVDYCVKVDVEIRTNKNTLPSQWRCIFISKVESRSDAAVLGPLAAVLILVIGFLMTSIFFLSYTGFLCKRPTALPSALEVDRPVQRVTPQTKRKQTGDKELTHYQVSVCHGYTLIPERADLISIRCTESRRAHVSPTAPHLRDDPQDEERTVYMDRIAERSSDERYCRGSLNGSSASSLAVSEDCGGATDTMEVPAADVTAADQGPDRDLDEPKAEGATVSFLFAEAETGVRGHAVSEEEEEEEEEEEVHENSGDVNLFSVTIAALTVDQEVGPSLLLASDSGPTVSSTDCHTESDAETTVPLMQPTHQDCPEPQHEERHADTQSSSSSEEEEEEEYSEYMSHL